MPTRRGFAGGIGTALVTTSAGCLDGFTDEPTGGTVFVENSDDVVHRVRVERTDDTPEDETGGPRSVTVDVGPGETHRLAEFVGPAGKFGVRITVVATGASERTTLDLRYDSDRGEYLRARVTTGGGLTLDVGRQIPVD